MRIFDLEVGVKLDAKGVSASLKRLEKEGRQTDESLGNIGDGAERSQKKATGAFGRIAQSLKSLRRDTARPVEVRVDADASSVVRARQAVQGLRGEGRRNVRITVDADVGDAITGLGLVSRAKREASGKATIDVDAETASALSGIGLVNAAADRLDGREINIRTDRSRAGLGALSVAASGVGRAVQGMDSGLSAGGVRIAMIGGVAATAAALFTPLLGALASVGSLGAAAGAGIGLIVGPLIAVIGKLKEYHQGLEGAATAQGAAESAAQSYADAQRGVDEAVANRGQVETQVAQQVGDAWKQYERQQEETARTAVAVQQANADAAQELQDARTELAGATGAVIREQREYNEALEDEPRNQAYSALDLADARDRLSDATRQYNEDVAEYGANSEEATDSLRAMQRAELDLQVQQEKTNDTQQNGSEELRNSYGELVSAQTERGQALLAVEKAEENANRVALEGAQRMQEARQAEADQFEAYRRAQADGQEQIAAAQRQVEQAQRATAQAADAQTSALQKLREATVSLTPAQLALYNAAMRFASIANRVFTPAQDAAAGLATRILNDTVPAFGILNRTSVATIAGLGRAWDGFVSRLRMPAQQQSVGTLLGITPQVIQSLTSAVGDFGLALLNIFATAAPSAVALGNAIQGAASRMLAWSSSTSGINAVRGAIAASVPVFQALGRFVMEVGGALFRFGATNAPAIATAIDFISRALAGLIDGFSWLTRVFGPVVPIAAALTPVFLALMLIFGQVGAALVGLVSGVGFLFGAFSTLAGMLGVGVMPLLGVLAVAVAAVAAGVLVLYRNWDRIKTVFAPLVPIIARVRTTLQSLGTVIRGLFTGNTGTEGFRRAFASLPGPVQNAVKLIVIAWRGLRTSFSQAWTQMRPILTQIANGLKTGLVTAFNFAVSQGRAFAAFFKSNWPQIRATVVPVLQTIGNIIRTVLVGAFKFALSNGRIFVNWFRTNWPLIRQTTLTVFNAVRAAITGAFQRAWMIIRPIIAGLVAFWRQNSTQILTIARTAWNTIKTVIQTAIRVVLGIVKTVMQLITGDWRGAWNTIRQTASVVWQAIQQLVRNGLNILKNLVQIGLNVLKTIFQTVWNAIKTVVLTIIAAFIRGVVAKFNELKARAGEIFQAVKQAITSRIEDTARDVQARIAGLVREAVSRFETFRDRAGEIFNAAKDRIVNPIRDAVSGVKSFIDELLGVVNGVLKKVGLPAIGEGSDALAPVGSRRFASGGMAATPLRRFAKGGMGTSGKNPRMHLWNEQQGGEAFIAEKRPAKEQLPYLQTAADWHGYAVIPSDPSKKKIGPHATHVHADGGLEGADYSDAFRPVGVPVPVYPIPTLVQSFAGGGIGAMYEAVKSKFGIEGFNNHGSYLSGRAALDSLDFMVTTPGARAEGSQKELGDNIAAFTAPPSAVNTIWYGQANWGGGWQPYSTGPGVGNSNTLGHYDHIHAQAYPDQFRGAQGNFTPGSGGGGGPVQNFLLDKFNGLWNSTVQPLVDRVLKPLKEANYVLMNAVGAAAQKVPDGIKNWITEQLGLSGGPGGVSGNFSGSKQDMAKTFAQNAVSRGMPGRLPVMTSMQELGGYWFGNTDDYRSVPGYSTAADHDSLGFFQQRPSTGWGTPEQIMDPAYALGKFLDAAEGYKGQYSNDPGGLSGWAQAVQRSAFPDAYAKHWDAAGKVIGDPKLYSDGGLAVGPQLMALAEKGGKELVLPLDNAGVMRSAQTALGTAELTSRIASLERAIVGKLDDVNLSERTNQKQMEIVREGSLGTMKSPGGQKVITNTQVMRNEQTRRMGAR